MTEEHKEENTAFITDQFEDVYCRICCIHRTKAPIYLTGPEHSPHDDQAHFHCEDCLDGDAVKRNNYTARIN